MEKIIKQIKNILYTIGIFCIFSMEIIFLYDWFNGKDGDWYTLFLIIVSFYSTCIMISKIIKSRDHLERIQSIIHNKNIDDETKLNDIEYQMFDIDAFLNDK